MNYEHKMSVKVAGSEDKLEFTVNANLDGLELANFITRGLNDFAANLAKPVRDGDQTVAEFVAGFQEAVEKYSRGESLRQKGDREPKIDTILVDTLIFNVKGKKTAEEIEAAGLPAVPLNDKGKENWRAWAKTIFAEHKDHAWAKKISKVCSTSL